MAIKKNPIVQYSKQPRFKLEPYSGGNSRFLCPSCKKKNVFARYIDVTTGEAIRDDLGRCNREGHCGYHAIPSGDDLKGKKILVDSNEVKEQFRQKDISNFMDSRIVIKTTQTLKNNFTKFIFDHFDNTTLCMEMINRYKVGTIDMWESDATVFWQIDSEYRVRTGKIMLYDSLCSRVKEPFNHISWMHTPYVDTEIEDHSDYCLTQCFFGEHLLTSLKPDEVHVVESEKTAILAAIMSPEKVWIATGGIQLINEERMLPFRDTKMIFYPDKGKAFHVWTEKVKKFEATHDIKISNVVEEMSSLREGEDLADFIIKKVTKN